MLLIAKYVVYTFAGKDVAKVLVPGPEVNLQEKMKVPQALPGADSLCQLTRIEPLSAGCRTTEPFTENGCSEVAKSVIQDSFGDDHAHDSAVKRPSSHTSDKVDIGFFERIKGNINSPVLPENSSEMHCFCSKDDGWKGEILLPDGNKKGNFSCNAREAYFLHQHHNEKRAVFLVVGRRGRVSKTQCSCQGYPFGKVIY